MSDPYHEVTPIASLIPPSGPIVRRRLKRLEEKGYVVVDNQAVAGTLQFYVTRQTRKRYGGTIANEGSTNLTVQIETTAGYFGLPKTLPPGTYLLFEDFILSGLTIKGTGTFSLTAWAGKNVAGKLQYFPTGNTLVGPIPGANHLVAPWYQPNFKRFLLGTRVLNVAPHTIVTRLTYTVPAARLAFITSAMITAIRTAAPTTAGLMEAQITEAVTFSRHMNLEEIQPALGIEITQQLAGPITLIAGDSMLWRTSDASTGGTYNYIMGGAVQEFDT